MRSPLKLKGMNIDPPAIYFINSAANLKCALTDCVKYVVNGNVGRLMAGRFYFRKSIRDQKFQGRCLFYGGPKIQTTVVTTVSIGFIPRGVIALIAETTSMAVGFSSICPGPPKHTVMLKRSFKVCTSPSLYPEVMAHRLTNVTLLILN